MIISVFPKVIVGEDWFSLVENKLGLLLLTRQWEVIVVLICTLQLFTAYKELSFTRLIRFSQPSCDINRTGAVIGKGRLYYQKHQTQSDKTSV